MIKLDETDKENVSTNPECTFTDHITWLRSVFIKARANSTGEKFESICKLQNELDALLEEIYNPD